MGTRRVLSVLLAVVVPSYELFNMYVIKIVNGIVLKRPWGDSVFLNR